MGKSERTYFSDLAIYRVARGTRLCFPALLIDLLADLCAPQVIDSFRSELLQIAASFRIGE